MLVFQADVIAQRAKQLADDKRAYFDSKKRKAMDNMEQHAADIRKRFQGLSVEDEPRTKDAKILELDGTCLRLRLEAKELLIIVKKIKEELEEVRGCVSALGRDCTITGSLKQNMEMDLQMDADILAIRLRRRQEKIRQIYELIAKLQEEKEDLEFGLRT